MLPHVHECCVCGMNWSCDGIGRGKTCEVIKAEKVNRTGPYCNMCLNGIMFLRYAQHRQVDPPVMLQVLRKHEIDVLKKQGKPKGGLL